jgi:hypothetical protein
MSCRTAPEGAIRNTLLLASPATYTLPSAPAASPIGRSSEWTPSPLPSAI